MPSQDTGMSDKFTISDKFSSGNISDIEFLDVIKDEDVISNEFDFLIQTGVGIKNLSAGDVLAWQDDPYSYSYSEKVYSDGTWKDEQKTSEMSVISGPGLKSSPDHIEIGLLSCASLRVGDLSGEVLETKALSVLDGLSSNSILVNALSTEDILTHNNLSIINDLSIGHNLSVHKDLYIAGSSNLRNNLIVGYSENISGNLFVGGGSTGGSISARENISAKNIYATNDLSSGNLTVSGDISTLGNISGQNIYATNDLSSGNLTVSENISAQGNISAQNIYASNDLSSGNLTVSENISTQGNISAQNIYASNDLSSGNLSISGDISAQGNISAQNINITNDLTANNLTGLSDISATQHLYVNGIDVESKLNEHQNEITEISNSVIGDPFIASNAYIHNMLSSNELSIGTSAYINDYLSSNQLKVGTSSNGPQGNNLSSYAGEGASYLGLSVNGHDILSVLGKLVLSVDALCAKIASAPSWIWNM